MNFTTSASIGHCCMSLSGNCDRRGGEGRGEEGRERKGGEEEGGREGGKWFVCCHICELAPVTIRGEDLGNNTSMNPTNHLSLSHSMNTVNG